MNRIDRAHRRPYLIAVLLFGAALVLYLVTLAPSVTFLFDDSLEFQLVAYEAAIAHPTGYPLFTLLGWLFTRLPAGEVAWRVNLMSACCGAFAVALTYLLGRELVRGPGNADGPAAWPVDLGAALGAIALAVSPVFWSQATVAEVYTLNAAIVTALLWALVRLARLGASPPARGDGAPPTGLNRWLLVVAALFGLGLAHHRTSVLLAPAAALVLWRLRGRWSIRPALGLAFALPLLFYLYIPLRGHVGSLDGNYTNTFAGFIQHVTATGYGAFILDNPLAVSRGPAFYADMFVAQFGLLGIGAGLIGLIALWQRRAGAAVTVAALVAYGLFNLFYRVADIEVFFIPLFIVWAVWLGAGSGYLMGALSTVARRLAPERAQGLAGHAGMAAVGLALLAQAALPAAANLPRLDRSHNWAVHDYGIDMLSQPLPPGAAVVGIQGEITLLRYLQSTHGLRTDLLPVAADRPEERLDVVDRMLKDGRPVYLTRDLAGAAARWSLGAQGPLIRVLPQPLRTAPGGVTVVDVPLTPHIALYGYAISRPPGHAPLPPVRLALVWHARQGGAPDLKVSARLLAPDGQPVAQADAVPVHFAYPTTAWRAGELISDGYDLPLPGQLAAGAYTPLIILYDPARGAAEVGRVTLPALYLP